MPKKKSSFTSDSRTRTWTFILYPESAPPKWQSVLDEERIAWIGSPLHDKDVTATGELKKPHWHVLLLFAGKKSFNQVKEITDKLNATIPQKCADKKALVRYMAHLDNPEKAQYDKSAIIAHGGVNIDDFLISTISQLQRDRYIKEMASFVRRNRILEFNDIAIYAENERYEDWFPLLNKDGSCMNYIKSVISSLRFGIIERDYKKFKTVEDTLDETVTVNPETGEVVADVPPTDTNSASSDAPSS